MSKYRLSKLSGVPKTTVMDICSGKSSLQKCSAGTIWRLAKALQCTMEEIMAFDRNDHAYDEETGLPINREYLERGLPPYLQTSIKQMCASWAIEDSGKKDYHWDIAWNELNADINAAESGLEISSEQAWYLREKYLRMKRGE
ncbi:MAG TPA: helix-turn-helix transcriptional regulator [Candidatus Blautia avistercoris]|nr:helix-turn-helix transcriptional regulator [Candidatus Blautia avistercoris]